MSTGVRQKVIEGELWKKNDGRMTGRCRVTYPKSVSSKHAGDEVTLSTECEATTVLMSSLV